jgi:transposase
MLEKYFKEKYTSGMKCELMNERLQTKWLNGQIQVRVC